MNKIEAKHFCYYKSGDYIYTDEEQEQAKQNSVTSYRNILKSKHITDKTAALEKYSYYIKIEQVPEFISGTFRFNTVSTKTLITGEV